MPMVLDAERCSNFMTGPAAVEWPFRPPTAVTVPYVFPAQLHVTTVLQNNLDGIKPSPLIKLIDDDNENGSIEP